MRAHYDKLLDQLDTTGCLSDPKVVYRILMRLGSRRGGKKPAIRPLPMLKDQHGKPVQSFQQQQELWLCKISLQEAGAMMTIENLRTMNRPGVREDPTNVDLDLLPDMWSIQQDIKKIKPGKTAGPEKLPSDLVRNGGNALAVHLTALFSKASTSESPVGGFSHCGKGRRILRILMPTVASTSATTWASCAISSCANH